MNEFPDDMELQKILDQLPVQFRFLSPVIMTGQPYLRFAERPFYNSVRSLCEPPSKPISKPFFGRYGK